MFTIRVAGVEDSRHRLYNLQAKMKNGAMALSPQAVLEIDAIVRQHDSIIFMRRSKSEEWSRVTLPAAILSRQDNAIGRAKTIAELNAIVASSVLPLFDTHKLFNSIAQNNADHVIQVNRVSLTIGTAVEYAAKHFSGDWQVFEFTATEMERLYERVEMPADGKDRQRDFYRFRTWARQRYPIRAYVPARSWFAPLPEIDKLKISAIVSNDLVTDL